MLDDQLSDYIEISFNQGRDFFIQAAKALVQRDAPELFRSLDITNDEIFLNPYLLASGVSQKPKLPLHQLLYGSFETTMRPERIIVRSNHCGVVYLPNFGYLNTDCAKEKTYELIGGGHSNHFRLRSKDGWVKFTKDDIPYITDTKIEIQSCSNEWVNPFFGDEPKTLEISDFRLSHQGLLNKINNSIEIIRKCCPNFYKYLEIVARCVILFGSDIKNSFANTGIHGACFINISGGDSTSFFLEEIVHQCGHIIFTNITHNPEDHFLVNPETSLKEFNTTSTLYEDDNRSLYVAFHGVFTEVLMCEAFDACIRYKVFNLAQEHELRGRFAYILLRLVLDIGALDKKGVFTNEGETIFSELRNSAIDKYKNYHTLIKKYDLTNQPYSFSYKKFIEKNPY